MRFGTKILYLDILTISTFFLANIRKKLHQKQNIPEKTLQKKLNREKN